MLVSSIFFIGGRGCGRCDTSLSSAQIWYRNHSSTPFCNSQNSTKFSTRIILQFNFTDVCVCAWREGSYTPSPLRLPMCTFCGILYFKLDDIVVSLSLLVLLSFLNNIICSSSVYGLPLLAIPTSSLLITHIANFTYKITKIKIKCIIE